MQVHGASWGAIYSTKRAEFGFTPCKAPTGDRGGVRAKLPGMMHEEWPTQKFGPNSQSERWNRDLGLKVWICICDLRASGLRAAIELRYSIRKTGPSRDETERMRDRDRETEEQSEALFRSSVVLLKLKKSKEAVILPGISPTGDCGPALHELVPGSRTMHNAAKVLQILNLELGALDFRVQ